MKIVFFGIGETAKRIKTLLEGHEVVVRDVVSERAEDYLQDDYDFIMVDTCLTEAEKICQLINLLTDVPVIGIYSQRCVDWRKLCEMEASGYVPETISRGELLARLDAVKRRSPGVLTKNYANHY